MGALGDHPIDGWREDYGLKTFVETGIGAGDGVMRAMQNGYERIFSIEASPAQAAIAIQRIGRECPGKPFGVLIGPSPAQLRLLMQDLRGPTLFWLDAHIPKFYGHDIGEAYPLLSEVRELTRRSDFHRDVIVADDMAMYGLETDEKFPLEVCPTLAEPDVVMRAMDVLRATHDVTFVKGGYGHLVALPR